MVKVHFEKIKSNFEGTIIDIESIGEFRDEYNDSRRYIEIIPVIFGYITKDNVNIHCAKTENSIEQLKKIIREVLPELKNPLHAFNSEFEKGTLFHNMRLRVIFERELNKEKYEPKWFVVKSLKIPNYDDPFNDDGRACMKAWLDRKINEAIMHNRACLLKERDILLKRGFREPDEMKLVP